MSKFAKTAVRYEKHSKSSKPRSFAQEKSLTVVLGAAGFLAVLVGAFCRREKRMRIYQ